MPSLRTSLLEIAYEEGGPAGGVPVLLLHGWPDDVRGWRGIAPALEAAGFHWVAPWLRGHGPTRFLRDDTLRDGRGVALAHDAIDVADALGWKQFAVIGHDWGARAAYTLAALFPTRIERIVTLALGYAPRGAFPMPSFAQSRRWWYQWFMSNDRGADAVRADPKGFARVQWETWSPPGWYEDDEFAATAKSFENPDWLDITLHAYRSRWQHESSDDRYAALAERLATVTELKVPTLMFQGEADACDPPSESDGQEKYFVGGYQRVLLPGVGHFPAREAADEVARRAVGFLAS